MRSFALFCGVAAGLRHPVQTALLQRYEADMNAEKLSPVQKVVAMLKDMSANLAAELEQDKQTYLKLNCWCNSNNSDKKDAIEANSAKAASLTSAIEAGSARKKELDETIAQLTEELKANTEALAQATEVRNKEKAEFQKAEKANTVNVQSLKAAITVLSKHQGTENETEKKKDAFKYQGLAGPAGGDFLQMRSQGPVLDAEGSANVASILKTKVDEGMASRIMSALQAPGYANQSGEIFGILNQMLEDMQGDLAADAKEESEKSAAFADLKAAKTEEIESGAAMKEEKEDQLSKCMRKLANDKEDLEDTEKQLAADREFVENLDATCADIDAQWDARQKIRAEEQKAVAETIGILTSDDAKDTFHNTFGHGQAEVVQEQGATVTAFLQVEAHQSAFEARARAAALLRKVAASSKDQALVTIAAAVQLDAFTKVKKAINDMVAMLKEQQSDEVKQKDFCEAQFQENEQQTTETNFHKEDVQQSIADLEQSIETLASELADLASRISQARVELQRASLDRQAESHEFQAVLHEQTATEKVLNIALNRMEEFYVKKETFLQASNHQAPPVKFQDYEKGKAASPILSMLNDLITDAKKMQVEAKADEQKAQDAYIAFVKETNANVAEMQRSTVNKNKQKADAEENLADAKAELNETLKKLEKLGEYNGQLHLSCDFVLKNFDLRQQARSDEMEGLQAALGILSGALA